MKITKNMLKYLWIS